MLDHINEHLKNIFDAVAAGVGIATLAQVLPFLASTLSIAWLVIRLYDRYKYGPNIKE